MGIFFDILTIIGALGLFIYGMKIMSEGIQRAAGSSMRKILGAMTKSQSRAIFTGFLTTSIVQSSSATSVMVVSFVNAGLLQLREAVGVIMGANIGTTVTAWLIALALGKLSVSDYALPIIALALPLIFFKKENLRNTGESLVGFAILFLGLQALQRAVPNLREHPEALAFLDAYLDMGFVSILLFVFTGTVVTLIVQSSSAAIALTLTLLSTGILPVELAIAMVLGENIGTTITANLAAIVANVQAKRAARSHFIFNLIGVLWMLPLLTVFIGALQYVFNPMLIWLVKVTGSQYDKVLVALFHTSFNLLNTLLLVGLTGVIVKIAIRLVPAKGKKEEFKLEYIGSGVMGTPELALLEAYKEIARFAKVPLKMNASVAKLLDTTDPLERSILLDELKSAEEVTDKYEVEIANYLTELAKEEMSPNTSVRVRGLLTAANDLEKIGDIYYQIAMNLENKNTKKVYFVPKQRQNLKRMCLLLEDAFDTMLENLDDSAEMVTLDKARSKEEAINQLRNELRNKHLKDIGKGRYSLESGLFYSDTFTAMEEIADHIISVSEGLAGKF